MTVASTIIRGGSQDGQAIGLRSNRDYDLLTAAGSPPLFDLARRGRVFTGNIAAAGVVLPIYSNTTQQVGLWNPAGNDVDAVLLSVSLTYVDTTGAAGGFVLGYLSNAPAQLATGAAITAFTETTAINSYLNNGAASKVKFAQGSTITVTAPSVLRHVGLNQTVLTAATTSSPQWTARADFDGDVIVTPGSAIFVAGNIATLIKVAGSVVWAEFPRNT